MTMGGSGVLRPWIGSELTVDRGIDEFELWYTTCVLEP